MECMKPLTTNGFSQALAVKTVFNPAVLSPVPRGPRRPQRRRRARRRHPAPGAGRHPQVEKIQGASSSVVSVACRLAASTALLRDASTACSTSVALKLKKPATTRGLFRTTVAATSDTSWYCRPSRLSVSRSVYARTRITHGVSKADAGAALTCPCRPCRPYHPYHPCRRPCRRQPTCLPASHRPLHR